MIPIEINNNNYEKTLIILPFDHPKRTSKEVFEIIRNKLENLDLKPLLFLKNIEYIKWEVINKHGDYFKKSKKVNRFSNVSKTIIVSELNGIRTGGKYLVIDKPVKLGSLKGEPQFERLLLKGGL